MTMPPWLARVAPIGLALLLGAAGGALFSHFRMPLAWMIGSMTVTTVASLAGAPVQGPGRLRGYMIPVLGIMLGSTFTPEVLNRAGHWIVSISCLFVFMVVVVAVLGTILRRFARFAPATAYFSATPGGLVMMVLMGGSMGGDERTISLMHSMRLLTTVLVIPFWFVIFHGYHPTGVPGVGRGGTLSPADVAVLALCAVVGYLIGTRARVPAGPLIGPLILSAAVHLTGLTQATPPGWLIAVAQVVMGTSVGCRFIGISVRRVLSTLLLGAGCTLFMMGAAALFGFAIQAMTGLSFQALMLAFSPGGLVEMTLISLALGIDTAFVSTHHLMRILFLVSVAPLAYRLLAGRLLGATTIPAAPPRDGI